MLPSFTVDVGPDHPIVIDALFADVHITDADPIVTPITVFHEWYRNGR